MQLATPGDRQTNVTKYERRIETRILCRYPL